MTHPPPGTARRVTVLCWATAVLVGLATPGGAEATPTPPLAAVSHTFEPPISKAEATGGRWHRSTLHQVCAGCDELPVTSDLLAVWAVSDTSGEATVSTVTQALGSATTTELSAPAPGTSTGVDVLLVVLIVLSLGVNVLWWASVGLGRLVLQRPSRRRLTHRRPMGPRVRPAQVAVLVAAHDEALGVAATVTAAHALVPHGNVFVVSDGSSDATIAEARGAGATVHDLQPNRGKAGALAAGIKQFALAEHFEVVMLLDADTVPAPDYLATGLPQFDDPDVVAVAGSATTFWDPGDTPSVIGHCLRAYRERQYVLFQALIKYGQAARVADAVIIVPGFASMYRTRVLTEIDVAAPGLVIEDFNMTFEVHARKLGRISFHPGAASARTQDPDNLPDYRRQVQRWSLGFWQTVRRHGFRRGRFWYSLAAFVVELVTSSVLFVLLVPLLLLQLCSQLYSATIGSDGTVGLAAAGLLAAVPLPVVLLGVAVPDAILTAGVALWQRRPMYLLLGLTFVPLRCLDAWICLRALWTSRSAQPNGTWTSPTRRPPTGDAPATGTRPDRGAGPTARCPADHVVPR